MIDVQPVRRQSPARVERLLRLEVRDGPDVLLRVLSLLQRRRCRVVSVDYLAADRHHPGRLLLGIAPPPRHAHCVEAWLENLVDVMGVDAVSS
jgi:acetolactate synthase regulatory subunit